jgi:hypothetical protein
MPLIEEHVSLYYEFHRTPNSPFRRGVTNALMAGHAGGLEFSSLFSDRRLGSRPKQSQEKQDQQAGARL